MALERSIAMNLRIVAGAALLALAAVFPSPAAAQTATVDEFLTGILSISSDKCRNRGDSVKRLELQGKAMEARAVRIGESTLCDCMPARLRALRAQLKPGELSQRVTQAEFMNNYTPRYMNACAADSLRQSYGPGCAETVGAGKPNAGAYCACMAAEVSKLTDAEAARLGLESADYAPAAAEARKRGQAAPPRPALLARMAGIDASCTTRVP